MQMHAGPMKQEKISPCEKLFSFVNPWLKDFEKPQLSFHQFMVLLLMSHASREMLLNFFVYKGPFMILISKKVFAKNIYGN